MQAKQFYSFYVQAATKKPEKGVSSLAAQWKTRAELAVVVGLSLTFTTLTTG